MNLDLFKTLIIVAKHKSVAKASEEVYLTPPAITKQIKQLEEEYNIRIFEFKSKKRILTEDGKTLLDYAERVLSLLKESKKAFNEQDRRLKGTLRIASNFALGVYVIPKLLKLYSDRHPDLDFNLKLENTEDVIKDVKEHGVNFGFVGRRPTDSVISSHIFYQDRMCIVVSPDMAIKKKVLSWKTLQGLPFLMRERGSDIRDASDEWLKQHNIRLNTKLELNNTEAIKTCIKCGLGFSLLPLSTIEQDVKVGYLGVVRAPHFNLVQTYYICHYRQKNFSKPEKVFLEFLFEAIESRGAFPNMDFPLSPLL